MSNTATLGLKGRIAGYTWDRIPFILNPLAYHFLFRPNQMRYSSSQQELIAQAKVKTPTIDSIDKKVVSYSWGEGPSVILSHGWAGHSLQFEAIIKDLVNSGYKVIGFDYPSNGGSPRGPTNFFDFYRTLEWHIKKEKNVAALIGHSMGCGPVLANLLNFDKIEKAILIAPQFDLNYAFQSWLKGYGLPVSIYFHLIEMLEERYQLNLNKLSPPVTAPQVAAKVQLIHDVGDKACPYQNSEKLLRLITNSELLTTSEQGHNRILRAQHVIDTCRNHISEN